MKKLIVAALLSAVLAPHAAAQYVGKLDLAVAPIVYRDINDGTWMGGTEINVWDLMHGQTQIFHLGLQYASHLGGPGNYYGIGGGVNITGAAVTLLNDIESVAALMSSAPPWLAKVGTWTSLELFGGYAPQPGVDMGPWSYGVGGRVAIQFSQLQTWMVGPNPQTKGL